MAWWLEEERLAFELGEEGEVGVLGGVGGVGGLGEQAGPRADAERKPSGGAKRSWSPAAGAAAAPADAFRFDYTGPADGV